MALIVGGIHLLNPLCARYDASFSVTDCHVEHFKRQNFVGRLYGKRIAVCGIAAFIHGLDFDSHLEICTIQCAAFEIGKFAFAQFALLVEFETVGSENLAVLTEHLQVGNLRNHIGFCGGLFLACLCLLEEAVLLGRFLRGWGG